jgi:hypothetical protein
MIVEYGAIFSGAYLIGLAFFLTCPNARSDLILRVVPGLIGVGNLIAGLKLTGFI